jgi:hypothetical protein
MTTVGVKWQKGVGIDWQKTDYCVVPPVWAEDLPLEGVHCLFNPQSRKWMIQGEPGQECAGWKHHPQRRGNPPFLRFIHAFGEQLTDLANPFHGDDSFLTIDPGSSVTTDGRRASCEIYFAKNEGDFKLVMRVFLIRTNKVSPIECYDERYLDACIAARAAVDQGYIDEEENIE